MRKYLIFLVLCLSSFSLTANAAEWYKVVFEGKAPEEVINYQKKLVENRNAVVNPTAAEYNGKFVVLAGPYTDERVAEIKQNFINKGMDPNSSGIFFQLTSKPKPLNATTPATIAQASTTPTVPVTKLPSQNNPVEAFDPNQAVPNCDQAVLNKFAYLDTFKVVNGLRQGLKVGGVRNYTYNKNQNSVMNDPKTYGKDNLYYVYFVDLRTWSYDQNTPSTLFAHCIFNAYTNKVVGVNQVNGY